MDTRENPVRSGLQRGGMAILYVLWLVISTVFTLPIWLFQQILPNRSAHHSERHGRWTPGRIGVVLCDMFAAASAYLIGDVLRCYFYQKTAWPEVEPSYGSTVAIHLGAMTAVSIAWPTILAWLGWYKPRWRSWSWRGANTIAAAILLGMAMCSFVLLFARGIFPRAQIGFVTAMLPLMTAVVWNASGLVRRWTGAAHPMQPNPDIFY